jgi:hypothetical protein
MTLLISTCVALTVAGVAVLLGGPLAPIPTLTTRNRLTRRSAVPESGGRLSAIRQRPAIGSVAAKPARQGLH